MAPLAFRPLAESDLPLLAGWLAAPHVLRWWRDPTELEHVRAKYLPRIHRVDATEVFVIVEDTRDIGMIQRYRLDAHPEWHRVLHKVGLDHRAAGIDYFIGEHDRLGKGLGSCAVRQFVDDLLADWPDVEAVAVTPQAENRASCRVVEKAGFESAWKGILDSDDPADAGLAVLYVRDRTAPAP